MKLHAMGLTILAMFFTTLSTSAQHSRDREGTSVPASDREWHGTPASDAQLTGVSLTKADIQRMLPSGNLRVDVVQFAAPPKRIVDIGNKMSESIARQPRWKRAQINELMKPQRLAPFGPELGLTRSEYKEFTAFLEKGVKFVRRGGGVITVQAHGDIIDLEGQGDTSLLTNVQIHLQKNQVSTPYGTLKIVPPQNHDSHPFVGSLNGVQWQRMTGTPARSINPPVNTSSATLVVGKNLDGKSGVLKYSASKFVNGRQLYATGLIVQFSLSQ